jgi:hypothetical protein
MQTIRGDSKMLALNVKDFKRVYYASPEFFIVDDTFSTKLIYRDGSPMRMEHKAKEAAKSVGMELKGNPLIYPDGVWKHEVREAV